MVLPVTMRRPDVDVLKSGRRHVGRNARKMLRRRRLDRRRVMRHPVRWSPIIERASDVVGRYETDLRHFLLQLETELSMFITGIILCRHDVDSVCKGVS